jgi:hypothetical protein
MCANRHAHHTWVARLFSGRQKQGETHASSGFAKGATHASHGWP